MLIARIRPREETRFRALRDEGDKAKDISFVKGRAVHARASKKPDGVFDTLIDVSSLNTYELIGKKGYHWRLGFSVALDMRSSYVIPFRKGVGYPHDAKNAILKVRKIAPILQ
jgi:hypothetical protein